MNAGRAGGGDAGAEAGPSRRSANPAGEPRRKKKKAKEPARPLTSGPIPAPYLALAPSPVSALSRTALDSYTAPRDPRLVLPSSFLRAKSTPNLHDAAAAAPAPAARRMYAANLAAPPLIMPGGTSATPRIQEVAAAPARRRGEGRRRSEEGLRAMAQANQSMASLGVLGRIMENDPGPGQVETPPPARRRRRVVREDEAAPQRRLTVTSREEGRAIGLARGASMRRLNVWDDLPDTGEPPPPFPFPTPSTARQPPTFNASRTGVEHPPSPPAGEDPAPPFEARGRSPPPTWEQAVGLAPSLAPPVAPSPEPTPPILDTAPSTPARQLLNAEPRSRPLSIRSSAPSSPETHYASAPESPISSASEDGGTAEESEERRMWNADISAGFSLLERVEREAQRRLEREARSLAVDVPAIVISSTVDTASSGTTANTEISPVAGSTADVVAPINPSLETTVVPIVVSIPHADGIAEPPSDTPAPPPSEAVGMISPKRIASGSKTKKRKSAKIAVPSGEASGPSPSSHSVREEGASTNSSGTAITTLTVTAASSANTVSAGTTDPNPSKDADRVQHAPSSATATISNEPTSKDSDIPDAPVTAIKQIDTSLEGRISTTAPKINKGKKRTKPVRVSEANPLQGAAAEKQAEPGSATASPLPSSGPSRSSQISNPRITTPATQESSGKLPAGVSVPSASAGPSSANGTGSTNDVMATSGGEASNLLDSAVQRSGLQESALLASRKQKPSGVPATPSEPISVERSGKDEPSLATLAPVAEQNEDSRSQAGSDVAIVPVPQRKLTRGKAIRRSSSGLNMSPDAMGRRRSTPLESPRQPLFGDAQFDWRPAEDLASGGRASGTPPLRITPIHRASAPSIHSLSSPRSPAAASPSMPTFPQNGRMLGAPGSIDTGLSEEPEQASQSSPIILPHRQAAMKRRELVMKSPELPSPVPEKASVVSHPPLIDLTDAFRPAPYRSPPPAVSRDLFQLFGEEEPLAESSAQAAARLEQEQIMSAIEREWGGDDEELEVEERPPTPPAKTVGKRPPPPPPPLRRVLISTTVGANLTPRRSIIRSADSPVTPRPLRQLSVGSADRPPPLPTRRPPPPPPGVNQDEEVLSDPPVLPPRPAPVYRPAVLRHQSNISIDETTSSLFDPQSPAIPSKQEESYGSPIRRPKGPRPPPPPPRAWMRMTLPLNDVKAPIRPPSERTHSDDVVQHSETAEHRVPTRRSTSEQDIRVHSGPQSPMEYTDLDVLVSRLEGSGREYEITAFLGPGKSLAAPPEALATLLPAFISVDSRRITPQGKVKLKLSLLGVRVTKCPICLGQFKKDEQAVLLPECGHVSHEDCATKWFREDYRCFVCRVPLLPEGAGTATGTAQTVEDESHGRLAEGVI